ncbi:MAG TPA: lysophospholipid acyltransferase family protein [Terracidiphilus sp.]|nr:lysophospholipid acyltransferase family protein [Terracidiphilus sp.]
MIRAFVLVGIIVALGLPVALVYLPLAALTGNATPLYNISLGIVRIALRLAGVRVQVSGLQNVPAHTACIFMANHISNLDPPALLPHIPGRTSAFLKSSLMRIPILGFGLRLAEFVPVSRDGRTDSAIESVRVARLVLQKGLHITTFVEGTRSPDGRLLPFKKGPFYLAMEAGAPCIPISIHGTQALMPRGRLRIRRGTARIALHPPIQPSDFDSREDLMLAVRQAIASGLPESMRN